MNPEIVNERTYRLSDAGGEMMDYGGAGVTRDLGMLQGVTPVDALDAATKGYVDGRGTGGPTTDWATCWGTTAQGFGWWPCSPVTGIGFATVTTAARGIARVTPVIVGARTLTIDALGVNVNAAVAATTLRLGLYYLSGTTLAPSSLAVDGGTIDSSTTGVKILTLSSALVVPANTIWLGLAVMLEGAAGTPTLDGHPSNNDFSFLGKTDIDGNYQSSWANASSGGDGNLPAVGVLTSIVDAASGCWFRRSA